MKRFDKAVIIPSLIIAGGTLLATYVAHLDKLPAWKAAAGLALMAIAVIGADALRALITGGALAISLSSAILGTGFVLAGIICRSSQQATEMIILLSGIAWTLYIARSRTRCAAHRFS